MFNVLKGGNMLKEKLKKNWLAILAVGYALIVALFWLALRVNWSGISKALGADKNRSFFIMETPLLICILLWITFALAFVAAVLWAGKKKWPFITSLAVSGVFTVVVIVVIALGAKDYMSFILPRFGKGLLISLVLTAFALLLFFPAPNKGKLVMGLKFTALGCAVLLAILVGFDVRANYFTYDAVVYAVEDDYQIVFSTNDNSIAWVEVGDEKFYDLYAGSMKSNDLVHKVSVPQNKLDAAKGYKVCAQQMIYRGPFGGYKGGVISKEYKFRPVDTSDGFNYYTMTDVHGARSGAVNAAENLKDMDLLVILGDSYSMIDSEFDAQFTNLLANDVTKGEFPVVYARGNHEIKGNYAEDLYKYVGSKNGNFYYWFKASDVFGVTLDIGEDHDDDWWEYYETAQFKLYQAEQTELLQKIAEPANLEQINGNFKYKLVCCHIPIQFVNSRINHREVKETWTALLNEIQPDMVVSGHQHDLYPFLQNDSHGNFRPLNSGRTKDGAHCLEYNVNFSANKDGSAKVYGGYVTDYKFNGFICGRRGVTQKDEVSAFNSGDHIGLATTVNFATGTQTSVYCNAKGEKVGIILPFGTSDATVHTEFITDLTTFRS